MGGWGGCKVCRKQFVEANWCGKTVHLHSEHVDVYSWIAPTSDEELEENDPAIKDSLTALSEHVTLNGSACCQSAGP